MDNYDRILDLAEHPERYSDEEADVLLSDSEAGEIYHLLCKTVSALHSTVRVSDKTEEIEWKRICQDASRRRLRPGSFKIRFASRAASLAAIIFTSMAAVAIGISVTVAVMNRTPEPVDTVEPPARVVSIAEISDTTAYPHENLLAAVVPVIFENATLETILVAVSAHYGVEVQFRNPETARLHLYYKFDPRLPLSEIVEQLNTFDQISISLQGDILTID